jgi:hypothetical protein
MIKIMGKTLVIIPVYRFLSRLVLSLPLHLSFSATRCCKSIANTNISEGLPFSEHHSQMFMRRNKHSFADLTVSSSFFSIMSKSSTWRSAIVSELACFVATF